MEKLIELLNEYEKIKENSEYIQFMWSKNYKGDILRYDDYDPREGDNLQNNTATTYLISKEFSFIKWLVDNDKIDFYTILKENGTFRKEFYAIENKKEYERLIMLLSVEDNPIEFLVSILK